MNIACIAHDEKKKDLVQFMMAYESVLTGHSLFATGTTGTRIKEATGLNPHLFRSGPLGGDQQIGAMIAENKMDLVLFFKDPLSAQPHEPDINALSRLCDVYSVPIATNMATAEVLIHGLSRGDLNWRELVNGEKRLIEDES
ncbi:methylglyoxal synthase [Alkalicoccus daliensis]|uniref:Methylglyoxal synthase n=1 Tax=Alkalicoccus daliensis TaxID=745820 RepID=A0A1H0AT35_9BACI|nr:methylglyoxal synthase [Alkalicoccus daliensis]SDN36690.1 methylglyoxal synthase [Alkalicoccus daliensis]